MLNTITTGTASDETPILIAHGLFGSARNWGVIAKRLSDTRQVVSVDMRNHGASPWSDSHTYPELAEDLAEVISRIGGTAHVIGHSMGGKAAMMLALTRPELVSGLIVADIAPTAYGHSQTPLIHAMRAVDLDAVSRRSEADAQLARSVEDASVRAFLLQSLDIANRRWRLNLDALEAQMDLVTGWPAVSGSFDRPALFLSGGQSDYVGPEHRDGIKSLFPRARFARINDAGHWLHAEQPRAFEQAARVFLGAL